MSQQRLIMLVFFLQPLAFGNWLARIPEVQTALGLEPVELAAALLGMPAGILLTLPQGGRLIARLGARRLLLWSFLALLALIPLAGLASGGVTLFLALMVTGLSVSLVELAMNVEAGRIEADGGRLIMSTSHGFWSLGIGAGSAIGALFSTAAVPVAVALAIGSIAVLPAALWACRRLPDIRTADEAPAARTSFFVRPPARLVAVCLFVLGIAMTEGAMADWSGIFLRDAAGVDVALLGYGYGIFAAMVAAGRFVGDALRLRLGAVRLARLTAAVALAGALLLTLADGFAASVASFGLIGFGVSVGFPLAVTAAGAVDATRAATNVAVLSSVSMFGFLVGPPLIGGITQFAGIRAGLMALIPLLAISFAAAGALAAARRPAPATVV